MLGFGRKDPPPRTQPKNILKYKSINRYKFNIIHITYFFQAQITTTDFIFQKREVKRDIRR